MKAGMEWYALVGHQTSATPSIGAYTRSCEWRIAMLPLALFQELKGPCPPRNRSSDFCPGRSMTHWQNWDARILRVVFTWVDVPSQK